MYTRGYAVEVRTALGVGTVASSWLTNKGVRILGMHFYVIETTSEHRKKGENNLNKQIKNKWRTGKGIVSFFLIFVCVYDLV